MVKLTTILKLKKMMKILFASAFALIGTFAMANDTKTKTTEEKGEDKKVEVVAPCSSWITVNSCGTYYLCADNYETTGDVLDAIDYFDEAKGC
ncbi:Uncharacterised protein [Weeksella virosa]|uniref:Uncharacterized protein n=2 Tax=Weeksella virosa TaxID=1014 RepID=F0NXW1_WEEVC|nr:hypothetical protein Weevi_1325 [Weeksella virosa DSM 16922]VEH64338.1 Uncharacterised protein [Weeksella virosa]